MVPGQSSPATGQLGGKSAWMAPDARTLNLLYVAHREEGVDVYSYPGGKLKGQLQDVRADGLCSGKNGDVLIPSGNEILEYAHGGTRQIDVLRNSLGGTSQVCADDPTTGNLAVSGGAYPKFGVAIYADAKDNPRIYRLGDADGSHWSCAYDNEGNLFVARASRTAVDLLELRKGAKRFRSITWGGRPARFDTIQWDGKYLAAMNAADASGAATVVRYSVRAGRATLAGEAPLKNSGNPGAFWIHGENIVVPGSAGVTLYDYPAGGSPTTIVKDARQPQAVLVSLGLVFGVDVTTYHYDNYRTGWDKNEFTLSYKNVTSGSFGLLHTTTLDDQVDTQPLIVRNELTTGGGSSGKHDVVYVTTENNTVYAIDASSGATLFSKNLGNPVPTPLGCNNNGPNVGIDGTPVIDLAANVMYVIAYTMVGSTPTYTIHELSLANLTDVVSPVVVAASHTLTDGTSYYFNATYQRQRPALLESNGNVYAGFGSFCDFSASLSRGWLLGWQAGSLTPLAANRLNDSLAKSHDDFFLSSIWMSGYGPAADPSGNIYFVTGNSDTATYNGVTNVQESVVKVSADLTDLLSIFTPDNVNQLDNGDVDFGSGGVLLLPRLSPSATPLAAAAGKFGTMFLLDQNNLGGYNKSSNNVLAQESIGGCWCGESYFDAAKDSMQRIVGSGGTHVTVWRVQTSPSIALSAAGTSPQVPDGQDPGFFTAVSSAGNHPGAIIWAVARPTNSYGAIKLFAFTATPRGGSTLETLYQATAGYWASSGANANIVPVIANGKVYVASYQQLDIFGLGGTAPGAATTRPIAATRMNGHAPHEVTGTLVARRDSMLALRTRTGRVVRVDGSEAVRRERSVDLVVGESLTVRGTYDAAGVLHATAILRAKPSSSTWPPDR